MTRTDSATAAGTTHRRLRTRAARGATATVVALGLVGTGVSLATAATPSTGTLTGCSLNSTGQLRLVSAASQCLKHETVVTWNTVGPAGTTGPAGPAGAPGADGADGIDGDDGAVGPAGPAGAVGAVGPEGPAGAVGPPGADGPAGPAGPAGAAGPAGPAGAVGPAGPAGGSASYTTVTASKTGIFGNNWTEHSATCTGATPNVVGGGFTWAEGDGSVPYQEDTMSSAPVGSSTWRVSGFAHPGASGSLTLTVYARCAS